MTGSERAGRLRVTVVGTGYLGATHAACMASLGFEVLGLDVDAGKVERLSRGELPFYEPGLEDVLRSSLASGRLSFTTSFEEVGAFGDVHFLCVGTPQEPGALRADLSQVHGSVDALLPHLRPGAVVVGKSTVPAGTAASVLERLVTLGPEGVDLVWNPEFLREGHAVADTLSPDRIVLGVASPRGEEVLRRVYADALGRGTPLVVTDLATAELVKVAANAFLATKISFVNAMAEVCEAAGADVTVLADALGHDARIGRRFLDAGLGFGGGCLPKDIRAFMARAGELGASEALTFLREVDAINQRRRSKVVDLACELVGSLSGARVTVLGAAFKPHSDDVRDSPALAVASACADRGARVRVHDPKALENARRSWPRLDCVDDLDAALEGSDVVLHLTEWPQYRSLDPRRVADLVARLNVVDGRNVLDRSAWTAAGFTYRGMGR